MGGGFFSPRYLGTPNNSAYIMETFLVILIIALCGAWFGRRIFKQLQATGKKGQGVDCGCGCSGCDTPQQTMNSSCCSADQTDGKEEK